MLGIRCGAISLALILIASIACAKTQIVDFSEDSIPILNQGISKIEKSINDKVRDKGDSSAVDFAVGVFTTDATWNDLNLSEVIPQGTKWVILSVELKDDAAGSYFMLRKNGYYGNINISKLATQVANVSIFGDMIVQVDKDRVVEYQGSNLAFVAINITVKGFIK